MNYLIFDFDGVLGDTFEPLVKINAELDGTDEISAKNKILNYYENKTPHGREKTLEEVAKWSNFYSVLGSKLHEQGYDLFNDFIVEIANITNARLAVVSSANTILTKNILEETNLNFTHVLGFQDHHSKEEKVKMVAKDWGVDLSELYYFTDTKTDFWELENILDRNKIIGCAWGWQGFEKLLEVLPENQILKQFNDIHLVIKPEKDALKANTNYLTNLQNRCKIDNRHPVVGGFILNKEGKVLIQKRSPDRRLYPNFWDISFGGHLEEGESIYDALGREMLEETGLLLDNIVDIVHVYDWEVPKQSLKISDNPSKREFDFIVKTSSDLGDLKIETGKVSEQRWINLEDLELIKLDGNLDEYVYSLLKKVLTKHY